VQSRITSLASRASLRTKIHIYKSNISGLALAESLTRPQAETQIGAIFTLADDGNVSNVSWLKLRMPMPLTESICDIV